MRYFFFLPAAIFLCFSSLLAQPIGSWQEHLPYGSTIDVTSGQGKVFAATPFSCFSVSSQDANLERLSRITGLTETGVQVIFCSPKGTLLIAYRNSSIDIVTPGKVQTINALQLKPINGDKTIYQVNGNDDQCLLSTGFGIVVLNLEKNEIGDTWVLGNGGAYVKINGVVNYSGYYYAATEEGLKRAPANGSNLADYRNWTDVSGTAGLPTGAARQVLMARDSLYVQVGTTLYMHRDNQFIPLYTDGSNWINVNSSADKIIICEQSNSGATVQVILPDGKPFDRISHPLLRNPKRAIISGNSIWIADSTNGLLEKTDQGISAVIPNSPASIGSGDMLAENMDWWIATGNALSHFSGSNWSVYSANDQVLPAGFRNAGPLVMDKTEVLWAGSDGGGLLKKVGDNFLLLQDGLLAPAFDDPSSYRVGGLAVDADNNLWISNSGALKGLVVQFPGGDSKSFTIPFTYSGYAISQIIIDDNNQKWILSPNGNGLFCFNHGASVENPADDQWRMYRAGRGNGNLPSSNILCIVKDAFGFIWVGTDDGIGIVQCTEKVFTVQGCEAVLPVVQTDQFAGYLFKGETVQAIAVDGANRKWIGTKNGLWLISANGEKTIYRFTTANSPLLDNDIRKIAIDHSDGTVLFSTASGICSFKGDATGGGTTNSDVVVYPNPVPPGYAGQVAIRGLVNNASVKITELNGRLVYQGRALGGQLVWNGRDLNGKTISTGIYLVLVSDDSRREQLVTKIVFIQR
ncbi:two-component regulator propeller domain-containing protein [Flavihumibacter fluvii]|uniref:type IX secretion system anionic LPS delivery protein PorZ n=1 Tax=Flavihumibacter fluvii TaxID=2838157 RepID=UPI001BDE4569|nr:two-component regulator propeller domain-containing protein [Flavihumibacter fluvii]ULQ51215.1 hypothetical protein KJS93_14085 [Flavihumibacter fluvii]